MKDSRMVSNGQSHAQLVLESGRMWVAVVCPSLPAPPLQNVLVQAVIQLPLQRLVRGMHTQMPCQVASQRGRVGVWPLGWDLRLLSVSPAITQATGFLGFSS